MVRKPHKIANNRATKRIPTTKEILADHNAKKVAAFKAKNRRYARRKTNHDMRTLSEAINDGRFKMYDADKDRKELKDVDRLSSFPIRHGFRLGDSWPDSGQVRREV